MAPPVRRDDESVRPGRPPLDGAVVVLLGFGLAAMVVAVVLAAMVGDLATIRNVVTALLGALGACLAAAIRLILDPRRKR